MDFGDIRVLVVGDVMLDRYHYGRIDRISPEAPVPIFLIQEEELRAGGAANVATAIANLGARVTLIGATGKDRAALLLKALLKRRGVDFRLTETPERTTTKNRYMVGNRQVWRTDEEQILSDELLPEGIQEAARGADILIVSDYSKGVVTSRTYEAVLDAAAENHIPLIVDPKKSNPEFYRGASVITPNLKELRELTDHQVDTDQDVVIAARYLLKGMKTTVAVVVKRSGQGASVVTQDEEEHIRPSCENPTNVTGAGDIFIAVLALGLSLGLSMGDAARLAETAAGLAVRKSKSGGVTVEELRAARRPGALTVNRQELKELCKKWRSEGKLIGLTNGCFDLLHPGHIKLIREAAKYCDRLVVALNSDKSIRAIKGPTRPIQKEGARVEVMAGLKGVAAITVFEEETPLELIKEIKPDTLIKGDDYRYQDVVGADQVVEAGGRVILVGLQPGYSTTSLLTLVAKGGRFEEAI